MSSDKKTPKNTKVGGIFFALLFALFMVVSVTSLLVLPRVIWHGSLRALFEFIGAALIWAVLAHFLIRAYLSVCIHECKHMICALLAGDKAKGMKIARGSGHFEYAYNEETAGYNAFIALAPYYIPL